VGPHVSVGDNTTIKSSIIQNTIIQTNSELNNTNLKNSMIGNFVTLEGKSDDLSVGDFNIII
jgi:glucose-1-phosphate thymidylyltransferase